MPQMIRVSGAYRSIADAVRAGGKVTVRVTSSPYYSAAGYAVLIGDDITRIGPVDFPVDEAGEWLAEMVWAAGVVYRIEGAGVPPLAVHCDLYPAGPDVALTVDDLAVPVLPAGTDWVALVPGWTARAVEDYLTAHPPTGGGGATDHGALTGLGDDDHPQYLNTARGDLLYAALATTYTKTETDGRIADVINAAPAALDTLAELATALGDDANFSATVTTALAGKLTSASNLSDLANAGTARTNLGLGGAAVLDVGTAAGQVAAGDDSRIVAASVGRYAGINAQTGTTYTPVLADEGKLVTLTNAAAITVTLPTDAAEAIPVGGRIDFAVLGAGMATFVAASGATVVGTPSLVTRAQYSAVSAIKTAANAWLVVGDLAG